MFFKDQMKFLQTIATTNETFSVMPRFDEPILKFSSDDDWIRSYL